MTDFFGPPRGDRQVIRDWFLLPPSTRRHIASRHSQRGSIVLPQFRGFAGVASAPATDPHFSNVVLLCHLDNNTSNVVQALGRGNTCSSAGTGFSTTRKFGTHSNEITSAPGYACRSATHADYNFSTGDWTVEFWVRPNVLTRENNSAKAYWDQRNGSLTAAWVPTISSSNDTGNLQYVANGSQRINGGDVMVAATFQHVAVSRASNNTRLFHNGTQVGSTFSDSNTYVQNQITVGAAGNDAGAVFGFFDDCRVTKGVGRYTANFSVPTAAFPDA